MSRQRTINDAEFWRSPKIADCSQEDKATLLYLLTSPYSNIVGVYPIVPRIAAAEMGWTADQLIVTVKRQCQSGLVSYDDATGFVWVKNWWDHNSAKMAVATTLRLKTYSQIDEIPAVWKTDFLADFLPRLPEKDDLRGIVARHMVERGYTVSIPYQYPDDRGAGNTNTNSIFNTNTNAIDQPISTRLEFPKISKDEIEQLKALIANAPEGLQQKILCEIEGKRLAGKLRTTPVALCKYLITNISSFCLVDGVDMYNRLMREAENAVRLRMQEELQIIEREKADRALVSMSDDMFEHSHRNIPVAIRLQVSKRRDELKAKAAQA